MTVKNNPYVKDLIFFLAAIVVSMAGFWMMTGRNLISRNEANLLVRQQTIALETKLELYHEGLLDQEQRLTKQEEKLQRILEKNTEAINDLRVQIATLSQSLSALTNRDS
tara:strand:+ start:343 stop:672 length:330 start_codon:yes stop_codon:yes gene_type:complete